MNYYNIILIFVFLIFLTMCNFLILNWLRLGKNFFKIKNSTYFILLAIFIFGFILRMFIVPHMHNLYYDEPAYLDIAKNIAEEGNNCLCLWNQDGDCKFCGFSLKSIGFSFFIALFFKIFGTSTNLIFSVVAMLGSLSIILMFFLTYFIFKKEIPALLASCILAFYPLHLRWSGSVSAEVVSIFFILLSFCSLFIFLEKRNITSFLALVFVTIFTITLKEECLMIIPFILIPFLHKKFLRKKFLLLASLFLLLFLPYLSGVVFFHTSSEGFEEGSRYTFWKGGSFFSWDFFKTNFDNNLYFFIDKTYTSFLVLLFLPLGLFFLFKDNKKILLTLLVAMVISPLIFSAYTGDHLRFSEVRHYIFSILPFILIICYGMYGLINKLKKDIILYPILLLILVSTFFYFPYLTSDKSPIIQAQQDYKTLMDSLDIVPKDCIILTQESYLLDFYDRNSVSLFLSDLELEGCIFYYEGELCYRQEARNKCSKMKDVVMENVYSNGRHSLYKINENFLDLKEVFKED